MVVKNGDDENQKMASRPLRRDRKRIGILLFGIQSISLFSSFKILNIFQSLSGSIILQPFFPTTQPVNPPTHPLEKRLMVMVHNLRSIQCCQGQAIVELFFHFFFPRWKENWKERRRKRDLTDLNGQAEDVGAFHAQWRHVPSDGGVQLLSFTFHLSNG